MGLWSWLGISKKAKAIEETRQFFELVVTLERKYSRIDAPKDLKQLLKEGREAYIAWRSAF